MGCPAIPIPRLPAGSAPAEQRHPEPPRGHPGNTAGPPPRAATSATNSKPPTSAQATALVFLSSHTVGCDYFLLLFRPYGYFREIAGGDDCNCRRSKIKYFLYRLQKHRAREEPTKEPLPGPSMLQCVLSPAPNLRPLTLPKNRKHFYFKIMPFCIMSLTAAVGFEKLQSKLKFLRAEWKKSLMRVPPNSCPSLPIQSGDKFSSPELRELKVQINLFPVNFSHIY